MRLSSTTQVRQFITNGWWAIKLIWLTNPKLSLGMTLATFLRGITPAGLALFARGLINAFTNQSGSGSVGIEAIWPWLLFGFAVTTVEAIAPLVTRFCTQRLHDEVNLKITHDVLVHSEKLEIAFFDNPRKRDLIDRAQQNPADRFMGFIAEAQLSITSLLQTISLGAVLILIEPWVLGVLAPFGLPYLLFQWRLSGRRHQQEYRRTPQRRWTRYFVSLMTSRHSVAEVRLLDLGPLLREKFISLMQQFRDQDRGLHLRSFAGSSLFAFATTTAFFLILLRVVFNVLDGVLTLGDVAVFGGATARLRYTLEHAIHSLSSAMEQTLYISNLIEFFNEQPQMAATSFVLPASCRGAVEFRNVWFTYPGATEPALKDVSFQIRPGETIAVVGENGAGKTTLAKLLSRLYDTNEGSIYFDNVDIKTLSPKYLYNQVGYVFQDFVRYEATAAENIAYGGWRTMLQNREQVERISRVANVDSMIRSLPDGYDTRLGRSFGDFDLSKGQWQRLAIARAFARNASVLILDEPAASLSTQAEYELFCRFHELSRGRTTILISHRFSTLSIADRIIVMEKGCIAECGTHRDLMARRGIYARLYRLHRDPLKSMARFKKVIPFS